MSDLKSDVAEATRLEDLWSGTFGDEYLARNANAGEGRGPFWTDLLARIPVRTVLEVGCNVGANLRWLAPLLGPEHLYGVDINLAALDEIRRRLPGINTIVSPARELPFRDPLFDLVFTAGVLIHQPTATLPRVMGEIVRTAGRYVLAVEYFAAEAEEVPYRGQEGALFRRDYGRLYAEGFPELRLVDEGRLGRDAGWDDVTWWLFERSS
jgi:pseudaminic acid biosynthesis-associated methylase